MFADMDTLEMLTLGLGAATIAALVTGVEWLPRYMKRSAVNGRLGAGHEPELRGQLIRAFVTEWLCHAVQLGLVGVAIWTRPSLVVWVAIVLVFALTLPLSFSADRARRSLLA